MSNNVKHTVKHHDKSLPEISGQPNRSNFPVISLVIVSILFLVSIWMLFSSQYVADTIIVQDVQNLHKIFNQINQDCKITGFDHVKNYVDFLTVKEFVGSQVGGMNLVYPKNWKGPYVQINPKVHEQQYIVLKNKKGYYLVPGDGVVLGNGKIIGVDIVFNEQSDIEAMLQDSKSLKSEKGVLAIKIEIGQTFLQKVLQQPFGTMMFE